MTTNKLGGKLLKKITISLDGLHCGSCVARIEAGLKVVPGIESVSVSLSSRTAFVAYDQTLLGIDHIKAWITELGYKVVGITEPPVGS